jgi:hypothetical protein
MILERSRWIHRQVETLQFLDADRVSRHVSVDFTVPDLPDIQVSRGDGGAVVFLPIALLRRQALENFDLRDESGAALSFLTSAGHNAIERGMLAGVAFAGLAKVDRESQSARGAVDTLAGMVVDRDAVAAERWHDACSNESSMERKIFNNPQARALIQDLKEQFVLFVPLDASPGQRRLVKFSLEAPIDLHGSGRDASRRVRLANAFLLRPWRMRIEAPIAGRADSVHMEVPAPDELSIAHAELVHRTDKRPNPPLCEVLGPVPTAHLHPPKSPKRGDRIDLYVDFAVRRDGLVTGGALIALTTSALLVGGLAVHLAGVVPRADSAGAVVVALPAVYAPVLTISSAHRLVRRIARIARMLILFSASLSFIAAASLAAELRHPVRTWLWGALFLASLPSSVVFAYAWLGARREPQAPPNRPRRPIQ